MVEGHLGHMISKIEYLSQSPGILLTLLKNKFAMSLYVCEDRFITSKVHLDTKKRKKCYAYLFCLFVKIYINIKNKESKSKALLF